MSYAMNQPSSDRLALLYELSQTFNSTLDLGELLDRVIDEVIQSIRAERGFLMLRNEQGELAFQVAHGIEQNTINDPIFQISMSIVEGVARDGKPVLTSDAQLDPRFSMRQSVRLLGLRSILCVPLKLKEQVLGTIYVDNSIQAGIFNNEDLELLSAIASNAAIAIENARLYRLAIEKGHLEQELQMARQLQTSLLPSDTPKIEDWEFAVSWIPARQVAGDFYDFIPGQGNQVGVIIADVSDKGMPAALFMGLSRSIIRASMDHTLFPVEGIRRANRLLCEDSKSGMFVTLFYALIDPDHSQVTYVNAGHNPALLIKAIAGEEGPIHSLNRTGMALGVEAESEFNQHSLQMDPGDCLVLYTDGVTDAMNQSGQQLGISRFENTLLRNAHAPAKTITANLVESIKEFVGSQESVDDITLLVIKRIQPS